LEREGATIIAVSGEAIITVRSNLGPSPSREDGDQIESVAGENPPLFCIAVHKAVAASGGADRTVRLWDVSLDALVLKSELHGHEGNIICLSFSTPASGDTLCSGSDDGAVKVWQMSGHRASLRWTLRGNGPVFCLASSPTGTMIACGCEAMDVALYDTLLGERVGALR